MNYLLADGESQSSSARDLIVMLDLEEGFENPIQVCRRNPNTGVSYAELDLFVS